MAFHEQDRKEHFANGVDFRTNYLLYNDTVPVRAQNTKTWTECGRHQWLTHFLDPVEVKQSLFII